MSFETELQALLKQNPKVNMNVIQPLIDSVKYSAQLSDNTDVIEAALLAAEAIREYGVAINPTFVGDRPATGVTFGASTNTAEGAIPVAQIGTVAMAGPADAAGTIVVRVTSALLTGGFKDIDVEVAIGTGIAAALNIRNALQNDSDVSALFEISGTEEFITLTALVPATNDETLDIAIQNDDSTNLLMGEFSTTVQGAAGVNQIESIEVTHAATVSETITIELTSALLQDGAKMVNIYVLADDSIVDVAQKIVDALEADEEIASFYDVIVEGNNVVLTAINKAENDVTLAFTPQSGIAATTGYLTFTDADDEEVDVIVTGLTMIALKKGTYAISALNATISIEELVVDGNEILNITITY